MNEAEVEVQSFSNQHINATIGLITSERAWRFTGFYGSPVTSQRGRSWELLRQLHSMSSLPWLCSGDFNEILADDEKVGGAL